MKNLSVIGIGKLGLCFALSLEKAGYNVCGVDLSQSYVDEINSKQYRTSEPFVVEYLYKSQNFVAITDLKKAVDLSDTVFVIVATPSLPSGKYDHSQVQAVAEKLKEIPVSNRKHLVICCTVMPGYTDNLQEQLDGYGWDVSYNPEFIAQGTIIKNQESPDMVLIGEANKQAGEELQNIYNTLCVGHPRICRMSRVSAELTKIGLNCFLINKIAYANMLGDLAETMGADTKAVLAAIAADSRVGEKFFKYGFGYGGPCLPRDGRVLSAVAQENNCNGLFGTVADNSNKQHLEKQVELFINKNPDKTKEVTFFTLTFKPESIMIEESQQLLFALRLASYGYKVVVHERPEVIAEIKSLHPNSTIHFVKR